MFLIYNSFNLYITYNRNKRIKKNIYIISLNRSNKLIKSNLKR